MPYKSSAPVGGKRTWRGSTMEGFFYYLDDAEKAGNNTVLTILKLMQELESPDKDDNASTLDHKKLLLDSKVSKYRFIPDFSPQMRGRGWTREWHVSPVRRKSSSRSEAIVLEMILSYALDGKLTRLRKCAECSRWFYAKVQHKTFCSLGCQQKYYRHSEKGKLNKKLYMREYRKM